MIQLNSGRYVAKVDDKGIYTFSIWLRFWESMERRRWRIFSLKEIKR